MSMTTENFGKQNRSLEGATKDANSLVDGLDPSVTVQTQDPTIAALKPSDANWAHCDTPNSYKNTQEG